jgi:hypothetical protein
MVGTASRLRAGIIAVALVMKSVRSHISFAATSHLTVCATASDSVGREALSGAGVGFA